MDKAPPDDHCKDYWPGPEMGKDRPVCTHYIRAPASAAGGCKHPGHFMCDYWLKHIDKKGVTS